MKENLLESGFLHVGHTAAEGNQPSNPMPSSRSRIVAKESKSATNVLYHYIDGFVIEEADTPFALETGSLLTKQQLQDIWRTQQELIAKEQEEVKKLVGKKLLHKTHASRLSNITRRCENCGKVGKGHHSARFCSLLCCRRFNIAVARRFRLKSSKLKNEQADRDSSIRKGFETPPLSPVTPKLPYFDDKNGQQVPVSPSKWSVENVCQYIESLPDAKVFAKDFREQEIDGSALLLIKEDHLISSLNIKLGPALKLCSHIRKLRERDSG